MTANLKTLGVVMSLVTLLMQNGHQFVRMKSRRELLQESAIASLSGFRCVASTHSCLTLGRNEDYLNLMITYALACSKAAFFLRLWPWFLRPYPSSCYI